MSPDDERHGTRRGYYAHRRAEQEACEPCKRGAAQAEMRYEHDRIMGRARRVAPTGTRRRLRALSALGWTWKDIAEDIGTSRSNVEKWANNDVRLFVYASTAACVAEVYDRLCMTPREGWIGQRTRNAARGKGWAPPLAWDDIDNDPEPQTGGREQVYDDVIVERLLLGEHLKSNRAEKEEAMRRWLANGGSQRELCRIHGWQEGRYAEKRAAA